MKHFIKYFAGLWVLAAACTSDEFKPADRGFDYLPLKTGFYQVYRIDSIGYSEVAEPDTLVFELMVEIVDSFPSSPSSFTFVLNRSKRTNAASPWQDYDTWSIRTSDHEAIVSEGNIPFVKLNFPVKKNITWDGNKFNSKAADKYKTLTADEPFTIEGTTFEKTVTIEQENNEDFILFQDKRLEVYARGVGLIYKEIKQLHYCIEDACRGQQIIESGTIYKQQLITYGSR